LLLHDIFPLIAPLVHFNTESRYQSQINVTG